MGTIITHYSLIYSGYVPEFDPSNQASSPWRESKEMTMMKMMIITTMMMTTAMITYIDLIWSDNILNVLYKLSHFIFIVTL